MENCALQDTLEAERWLHIGLIVDGQTRCLLINKINQLAAQLSQIGITSLKNLVNLWNIKQREQQMLNRHEFMTVIACILKGLVEAIL